MLRHILMTVCLVGASSALASPSLYDLGYTSLDGKQKKLSDFKGKPLLIVNTASHCGYTAQYKGLQSLYEKYKQKGLVIIGFPSQSFGQEFGKETEVGQFCERNYGVKFPMSSLVEVTGPKKHPVFQALLDGLPAQEKFDVRWNFEKFLVDKEGKVVARFASSVEPESKDIETALSKVLP